MRLGWFRATPPEHASLLDPTAPLIAELRTTHEVEVFTRGNAHDFVWKQFRRPYDLCIFELDNAPSHAFVWPYLLHYGGVLFLHSLTLHDSRAHALMHQRRGDDYQTEFVFNEGHPPLATRMSPWRKGTWPMLRVPLAASRLAVIPHRGMAKAVQEQYPGVRVVYAPLGVPAIPNLAPDASSHITFGLLSSDRVEVAERAIARARESGAREALLVDDVPERLLQRAEVMISLQWPSFGEPQMLALSAMAAGRPIIVLETPTTADWPALDPQTWQPRGIQRERPIVVSIDLRDEEHSLTIAMRRLSADAVLRAKLGNAAKSWWSAHGSARQAADAWRPILSDAASLDRPARPMGWPPHLDADGTTRARSVLAKFGVGVDFL